MAINITSKVSGTEGAISINGEEIISLTGDGNVGIGLNGHNTIYDFVPQLSIKNQIGSFGFASEGALYMTRSNNSTPGSHTIVANGNVVGALEFGGSDGANYQTAATIQGFVDGTPTTNSVPGGLRFFTTSSGDQSGRERMRIAADGNVGIGTSSPDNILQVGGTKAYGSPTYDQNIVLSGPGDDYPEIICNVYGGTATFQSGGFNGQRTRGTLSSKTNTLSGDRLSIFGGFGWNATLNAYSGSFISIEQTGSATSSGNPTAITFETNGGSSQYGTERMRIAADGVSSFFFGVTEKREAISASNINLALGNYFTKTISGTTTFTVSNVPSAGNTHSFILDLTNGGSATVNWWSNTKWAGGAAPTLTASGRDVLAFFTHDAGTTWNGFVVGKDVK